MEDRFPAQPSNSTQLRPSGSIAGDRGQRSRAVDVTVRTQGGRDEMKNEVSEKGTSVAAFDRQRLLADLVGMASSTLGVWFLTGLLCTIVTAILTASAIPSLLVAVIGLQMQVLDNYGKSVRNQDQKYRDFERRYREAQRADERRDEELLGEVKHQAESITTVSYTHLRAHETRPELVCRILL